MLNQYQQYKALLAITKASLIATLKNPSSIFFSLLFPLVFVFIFGSFGGGSMHTFKLAVHHQSDTSNVLFANLKKVAFLHFKHFSDTVEQRHQLEKGKIDAVITITQQKSSDTLLPHYQLQLLYTSASANEVKQLRMLLDALLLKWQQAFLPKHEPMVTVAEQQYNVREYRQIDFVLPGQIGFSILFATLFGVAYTFFNLREQLVLKRFYATPVKKLNILIGIGFSRISFQLLNVVVLILVGHWFLHFTLANGWLTFVNMIVLSIFMLMFLMGVGLIFSSLPKTDNTIPLYINVFSLPQMLLSGTFFPTTVFPQWLQKCTQILPLTHFNSAIRKISFEGAGLLDCWKEIGVLSIWIVVVYALVNKYFKWE